MGLVPYTFADHAPGDIPAEQLDANFAALAASAPVVKDLLADLTAIEDPSGLVVTGGRWELNDGGGGVWVFLSGNQTDAVNDDPLQGLYAAPDSAPNGNLGVWARQLAVPRRIYADWFTVVGDDLATIQGAVDFLKTSTGAVSRGGTIQLGRRDYNITSTWLLDGGFGPYIVEGFSSQGRSDRGTRIVATTPNCIFTGTITGDELTVTSIESGALEVGMSFYDIDTPTKTITALGTGTGGTGTYTLNASQEVPSPTRYLCGMDAVVCTRFDHSELRNFEICGPAGAYRSLGGYLIKFMNSSSFCAMRGMFIQRGYRLIGFTSGLGLYTQNIRSRAAGGDCAWHVDGRGLDIGEPGYPAGLYANEVSFGAADIEIRVIPDGHKDDYSVALYVATLEQVLVYFKRRFNSANSWLVAGTEDQVDNGQTPIVSLTWTAGVATATFAGAHGIPVGYSFTIRGATPDAFNGRWVALDTSTGTTLDFAIENTAAVTVTWASSDPQVPGVTGVATVTVQNHVPAKTTLFAGGTFSLTGFTPSGYDVTDAEALEGTISTAIKYHVAVNPGAMSVPGELVLEPSPTTASVPGELVVYDYWMEFDPGASKEGMIFHFAAVPPTDQYLNFERLQPQYQTDGSLQPIIALFEGRTASNKFTQSSGGFGGDGFVIRSDDPGSNNGGYMFVNWGLENCSGDSVRIESGSDYRFANCYMAGGGCGLNVVADAQLGQNISDATQTPATDFNGTVRITTTAPHGLPYPIIVPDEDPILPTVFVGSVLSSPEIYRVNGRWFVTVVSDTEFDLSFRALYLFHGQPPVQGAPSIWKQFESDPDPVYTPGTGTWNNRTPGTGNVRVANSIMRANGLSAARIDMPGVMITNTQLTPANSKNKDYWADSVISLTDNGTGLIRVTTKYESRIRNLEVTRLTHVTKAGVTVPVLRDTRFETVRISSTVFDLADSVYDGPYDAISDTDPVFILRVGASVELCEGANAANIGSNECGDWVEDNIDPQDYAIINKCEGMFDVHDNYTGGTRIGEILNFHPGTRNQFRNNYTYEDFGASVVSRFDDGINSLMSLFGSGSPEAVVTASPGSSYVDSATGGKWTKATGTGNTGWAPDLLEDTWTPVFEFDTVGDLSVVYTVQTGAYQRVGNVVWFKFDLSFTPTFSTSSGSVRITGLPYAALDSNDGGQLMENNNKLTFPGSTVDVVARTVGGQTYLRLAGLRSALAASLFTTTSVATGQATVISAEGSYRVA